jgi:hypothetical protein
MHLLREGRGWALSVCGKAGEVVKGAPITVELSHVSLGSSLTVTKQLQVGQP